MPDPAPLDVLYEDNHLLAVHKPAALPTMGVPSGRPTDSIAPRLRSCAQAATAQLINVSTRVSAALRTRTPRRVKEAPSGHAASVGSGGSGSSFIGRICDSAAPQRAVAP